MSNTATETARGAELLLGRSAAAASLRKQVRQVAGSPDTTVLLSGESGTGKELVAEAIHQESKRTGSLIRVGCSSIPGDRIEAELFGSGSGPSSHVGLVQLANGGTLLLDQISDLPYDLQPKLLRVLDGHSVRPLGGGEEVPIDVRFIAATAHDLETMVGEGRFRSELLFRIRVFEIQIPALRERPDDIPVLAQHFLRAISMRLGKRPLAFASTADAALIRYHWPGNVRELRNVIERAAILSKGPEVGARELALGLDGNVSDSPPLTLAEAVRKHILVVYEQTGFNKSQTAELLGISRSTLRAKLRSYDVEAD